MSRITHLLNQTATRYKKTGFDLYGKTETSQDECFKTREEPTDDRLVNQQGSEYTADIKFFTEPGQEMELDDKIVSGDDSYKVVKIERLYLGNGSIHHKEILAKRTNE